MTVEPMPLRGSMRRYAAFLLLVVLSVNHAEADSRCGVSQPVLPAAIDPTINYQKALAALGRRLEASAGQFIQFRGQVDRNGRFEPGRRVVTRFRLNGGDHRRLRSLLRRLRFVPARAGGNPVEVEVIGTIYFGEQTSESSHHIVLNHLDPSPDRARKVSPQPMSRVKRGPGRAPSSSFVVVVLVDTSGTPTRSWAVSPEYDPDSGVADPEVTEKDKAYLDGLFQHLKEKCYVPGTIDGRVMTMPFTVVTR